jgi:outer membrane protein insertion porin family
VTQGNLFGRGQLLRARVEKSTRRTTNYTLTFREPYLLDRPVSGTIDLFSQERNFTSYKNSRAGGSLSLNKSFGEFVTGGLSYTRENVKVFDVDPTASALLQQTEALGTTSTSSIGLSVARDTRDFFFDPKEGARHSLSLEYAGGVLGGDNSFYKVVGDTSRFFPLFWNTVFSLHLRIGYVTGIGREPSVIERFVVGGINTVRGFDFGRAGPVDPLTGDVIGGNKELIFNAEYLFPLVPEAKMKGVIFFDAGRGFDLNERLRISDLRRSAGFGIRMLLPIGPIRLEWGYNLDPQPGEKSGFFPEFTIGSVF